MENKIFSSHFPSHAHHMSSYTPSHVIIHFITYHHMSSYIITCMWCPSHSHFAKVGIYSICYRLGFWNGFAGRVYTSIIRIEMAEELQSQTLNISTSEWTYSRTTTQEHKSTTVPRYQNTNRLLSHIVKPGPLKLGNGRKKRSQDRYTVNPGPIHC